MMSTRYDFQITDNGDVIVLLPGGALCDFSQHGLSDERIAQAAFRQLIADIAERDARIERAESELARLRGQEPVAWMWNDMLGIPQVYASQKRPTWPDAGSSPAMAVAINVRPLYTTPPPAPVAEMREPTEEEGEEIYKHWENRATGARPIGKAGRDMFDAVRAVMWGES